MRRANSTFLDVLRLGAAFVVFLSHLAPFMAPGMEARAQSMAHMAVVIFFVLSGYVIAYTVSASSTCSTFRGYAIARLSRLYSVVVPALLLTAVLWAIGRQVDPGLYQSLERRGIWLRYAFTLFGVNEVWGLELNPLTNSPFWSLGYEAWYYVFFGLAWYVRPWRRRILLLFAGAVLVGPKILLLLPAWLTGMTAYFLRDRLPLRHSLAVIGFWCALGLTVAAMVGLPNWPQKPGFPPFYMSGAAISDFLASVGWALIIWFFAKAYGDVNVPEGVYRAVRWWASHTFSLYLYHAPLVIFAIAVVGPGHLGWRVDLLIILAILLIISGLGLVTESLRPRWQRFFGGVFALARSAWDGKRKFRVAVT